MAVHLGRHAVVIGAGMGGLTAAGALAPRFEQLTVIGLALGRVAARDPAVHRLTAEVQHLLKPRSVYREPQLVGRVLAEMAAT